MREQQHPGLQPLAAPFLPDFEALEETVGVLLLVGLLTDDGPEPPGIVDHRAEPVTWAAGAEVNKVRGPHARAWLQRRCSAWPIIAGVCCDTFNTNDVTSKRKRLHQAELKLTWLPVSTERLVVALPQHEEIDHVRHVMVPERGVKW